MYNTQFLLILNITLLINPHHSLYLLITLLVVNTFNIQRIMAKIINFLLRLTVH